MQVGLTTADILSILRGSGWEWGSNNNSSHFIYFKRVWMNTSNSSHLIYFRRSGLYSVSNNSSQIIVLRGSAWECGSNNSSHVIYFKRVWMGVWDDQQQPFHL